MIDISIYGPWAVIAGGSEGVGASFAQQLAEAGINLVLIARKPGPLAETAERVRATGVDVATLELDLLAPDALDMIRRVTDELEVGLLIYNAGANSYGHEFVTSDLARMQDIIDLNITTQLALTRHFGELMKERGRGGLLLVGSLAGYLGTGHTSVYSAVKAFGRIFAEGLWLELREHGVHVLELVLGVTHTPAMERAGLDFTLPGLQVSQPDDVAREGLEHLPYGPVRIISGNERTAEKRNGSDRAALLEKAHAAHQRLIGR